MSTQSETILGKKIMLALGSIKGVRLFRNNVGWCWQGQSLTIHKRQEIIVNQGDVVIRQARAFNAGLCKGSSDFIGFKSVIVTPEMVGKPIAVFLSSEIKTKTGKASEDQILFTNMVNKFGGIGIIVSDDNEAVELVSSKM